MIAITFALSPESSDLARSIDKTQATIFHTGVGPKIAAARIEKFLGDNRPEFVISSGFAGSLHDDLGVGDLILANNYSDPQLGRRARELLEGHNVQTAKLFTSNAIADSAAERRRLRKENSADAIDMETEVIARACAAHGIEMISLRVITDTPREPLPAPPAVLFDIGSQRTKIIRLLLYCVSHPATIPRLSRFAQTIKMARAELTSALLTLLRERHLLFGNIA